MAAIIRAQLFLASNEQTRYNWAFIKQNRREGRRGALSSTSGARRRARRNAGASTDRLTVFFLAVNAKGEKRETRTGLYWMSCAIW